MVNAPSLWLPKCDRHLPCSASSRIAMIFLVIAKSPAGNRDSFRRKFRVPFGRSYRKFTRNLPQEGRMAAAAAGRSAKANRTMSESKNRRRVPINRLLGLPDDAYADFRESSDRRNLIFRRRGRALPQFRLRNDSQRRVCISARTERPLGRNRCSTSSPIPIAAPNPSRLFVKPPF